jgi:hypothetical protein
MSCFAAFNVNTSREKAAWEEESLSAGKRYLVSEASTKKR